MNSNKKNIKYLNHLGLCAAMFLMVSIQSCVDLDEDPAKSQLAPGQYSSIEEFRLGVTGIYSQMRNASQWTTFYVVGWAGDDMTTHIASNKADFREYDQMIPTPLNGRTSNNWRDVYGMIRAANNVIESADGLVVADQDAYDRLLGEAYFLRGTFFLHMSRIHARIPLPLTSLPDTDIALASQLEVYQQIESDLLIAEGLLPDIYPGVMPGAPRPNKGSAKAILSRLYMNWAGFPVKDNSKYVEAAKVSKEVIDNSAQHGFGLVNDLEGLWKLSGKFNKESVWTVSYSVAENQPNRKFGILGMPQEKNGWQETFAEVRFFEDFPEGPRKEATYRTDLDWKKFAQQQPVFKKITGPDGDLDLNAWSTDRNDFYMRYAEVLLNYAESSGRAGSNDAEAWEALNMVRRRAAGKPWNQPDASVDITSGNLADLAFEERKWEFAGEYLRYNDLVRMEKVEEALNSERRTPLDPNLKLLLPALGPLTSDNYYAPIPQTEIDLNPNLGGGN